MITRAAEESNRRALAWIEQSLDTPARRARYSDGRTVLVHTLA